MNRQPEDLDQLLDRTLAEIRETALDSHLEQAAIERVRGRLGHEIAASPASIVDGQRIRNCADFQALLPAYREGRLAEARRLLLQDHLGECVPCRRAFETLRMPRPGVLSAAARASADSRNWFATWGFRAAAAAVIVVAVLGLSVRTNVFSFETGGVIHIESLDGEAFRFSDDVALPINAGDTLTLAPGESLRTAKGAAALIRLADDSRVEMRERSELAVSERRSLLPVGRPDAVLDLGRGTIIVEASDQGTGHLYVDTDECRVAVTGTVFSVNHGMKGSRVSVIEGEVHVDLRGDENVLEPGQQLTTSATLDKVPVEEEIAWSQNVELHLRLLREVRALGQEMDRVLSPDLRYDTTLLDVVPPDTVVYAGIPNFSEALHDAYGILQRRVASSAVLQEWWQRSVGASGSDREIEEILSRLRSFGDQLGPEVVLAVRMDASGEMRAPLLLAELKQPESFPEFVEAEIDKLSPDHTWSVIWVDEATRDQGDALYLWKRGSLLAASPQLFDLQGFASSLPQGGDLGHAATDFHDRLAELYGRGVEWAFGVDVGRFIEQGPGRADADARGTFEELGLMDARHLIAERKQRGEYTENRAVLTFDQPRRGLVAWLASPAPVAALDYISADANLAAAFVMKDTRSLADELFRLIGSSNADFDRQLAEFEQAHGIDVRQDIAAPLGGEFALALDGPMLPVPSWKVILEVYDPARMQKTLEWLVNEINAAAERAGKAGLQLERQQVGAREYFHVSSDGHGLGFHYVFDGGFMVAAPSRALLDRSLQTRSMGTSLAHSGKFTALLPEDAEVNFSAVVYQDLGSLLGPLTRQLIRTVDELTPEQRTTLDAAGEVPTAPSLAVLYGHEDRIAIVSTSEGGLFGTGLASLFSFDGLLGVQQSLARTLEPETRENNTRNE